MVDVGQWTLDRGTLDIWTWTLDMDVGHGGFTLSLPTKVARTGLYLLLNEPAFVEFNFERLFCSAPIYNRQPAFPRTVDETDLKTIEVIR